MDSNYSAEKEFNQIDFTTTHLVFGEYERCQFINCNFNAVDLSDIKFIDCEFIECNLSLVTLHQTSFQQVTFRKSKMIGFNLENCNTFALNVTFEDCQLNDSSFYQLPLKNTRFIRCSIENVDFSYTDLSNAFFDECNLAHTVFDQTDLKKANFKTAYNFRINPTENQLKGAIFSPQNLSGLVSHLGIKLQ